MLESTLGSLAWWQLEAWADTVIGVTFAALAALIFAQLTRTRQLRANPLAFAAGAVFAGCAVSRLVAAVSVTLVNSSAPAAGGTPSGVWGGQAAWDVLTAVVAVSYLVLRKVHGRFLTAGPLFDDLVERDRVLGLETLQAAAAARAEAEAERDAHAEMLESILASSQSEISVKDLVGRYILVNPAFERAFGVTESHILGQTDTALGSELDPAWSESELRAQERRYSLTEWAGGPNERRSYEAVRFPLHDAAGSLYAVGRLALDVTERNRADLAITEARDAAVAANAAKSAFLAVMSHEIRTPMNAVIGMTDLLMHTDLDQRQYEFAETVRTSGEALMAVINDILDFSKIESGQMTLESFTFDLREEVERCLDLVAAAATTKGLDLICSVDAACPQRAIGDVVRLRQIITNLLANAVKFTSHGEVLLEVTAAQEGQHLKLEVTVTDTGIGISPAAVERLFTSFTQGDASTTRLYGGTGLGLAICQRLAAAMGGGVAVTSAPNVGSTFKATVLLEPSSGEGRDDGVSVAAAPTLAGHTVLLVDDNVTNLRILDLQLSRLGMGCTTVTSPRAALELAADGLTYDIAVLDMDMPDMDGMQLAEALRSFPRNCAAPLILLTSVGHRPEDPSKLFTSYLAKPVKSAALRDTLTAALAGSSVDLTATTAGQDADATSQVSGADRLRILLVEDNLVNQRVALLMLDQLGHHVEIVGDGSEAVRAVEAGRYDVVLMDVQMPNMDGLEATRRIRSQLRSEDQPHIVAMTASALVEDREACAAAGMEAYLTKPIRVNDVREILARIRLNPATPLRERAPRTSASDRHRGELRVPVRSESAIDLQILDERMTELGDTTGEFRRTLIGEYLAEGTEQVLALIHSGNSFDGHSVAAIAHSLRSTSALLGAMTLAEMLQEAEATAAQDLPGLPAVGAAIDEEFGRVKAELTGLVALLPA